jgi:hypothetical protein
MSGRPNLDSQATAPTADDLSRRRLVTGAGVVAALGGATAEALAQGAPGGASGNLRFLNPPTSFKNPGFNHAVEAIGPGRILYIAGQQGRLRACRKTVPLFHRSAGPLPHDARYPAQIFRSGADAGLDHDPGWRADRREGDLRGRCGGRAAAGVSAIFSGGGP